jgi:hypothetical protein
LSKDNHFISCYKIAKDSLTEFFETVDGVQLTNEKVEQLKSLPFLTVKMEETKNGQTVYKTRGPNIGNDINEHLEKKRKITKSGSKPTPNPTLADLNPDIRMSDKQIREAQSLETRMEEYDGFDEKEKKLLERYQLRKQELELEKLDQELGKLEKENSLDQEL